MGSDANLRVAWKLDPKLRLEWEFAPPGDPPSMADSVLFERYREGAGQKCEQALRPFELVCKAFGELEQPGAADRLTWCCALLGQGMALSDMASRDGHSPDGKAWDCLYGVMGPEAVEVDKPLGLVAVWLDSFSSLAIAGGRWGELAAALEFVNELALALGDCPAQEEMIAFFLTTIQGAGKALLGERNDFEAAVEFIREVQGRCERGRVILLLRELLFSALMSRGDFAEARQLAAQTEVWCHQHMGARDPRTAGWQRCAVEAGAAAGDPYQPKPVEEKAPDLPFQDLVVELVWGFEGGTPRLEWRRVDPPEDPLSLMGRLHPYQRGCDLVQQDRLSEAWESMTSLCSPGEAAVELHLVTALAWLDKSVLLAARLEKWRELGGLLDLLHELVWSGAFTTAGDLERWPELSGLLEDQWTKTEPLRCAVYDGLMRQGDGKAARALAEAAQARLERRGDRASSEWWKALAEIAGRGETDWQQAWHALPIPELYSASRLTQKRGWAAPEETYLTVSWEPGDAPSLDVQRVDPPTRVAYRNPELMKAAQQAQAACQKGDFVGGTAAVDRLERAFEGLEEPELGDRYVWCAGLRIKAAAMDRLADSGKASREEAWQTLCRCMGPEVAGVPQALPTVLDWVRSAAIVAIRTDRFAEVVVLLGFLWKLLSDRPDLETVRQLFGYLVEGCLLARFTERRDSRLAQRWLGALEQAVRAAAPDYTDSELAPHWARWRQMCARVGE